MAGRRPAGPRSREIRRALDAEPGVQLLGEVDAATLDRLREAMFVATPSAIEGSAIRRWRRWRGGVPTLTSDAAALPEVVGDAGPLLPPDDLAAWAERSSGWPRNAVRAASSPSAEERVRSATPGLAWLTRWCGCIWISAVDDREISVDRRRGTCICSASVEGELVRNPGLEGLVDPTRAEHGRRLYIGEDRIADDGDCYVIAEVGHSHQGSVEKAMQLFEAAKDSSAHAVKLQKRSNRGLYTASTTPGLRRHENSYGLTYGEHREFLEFERGEYQELQSYAEEIGITFFATPFDPSSVEFCEDLGMPALQGRLGRSQEPAAAATDRRDEADDPVDRRRDAGRRRARL